MKALSNRDKWTLIGGGAFVASVLLVFYGILPFYESQSEIDQSLLTRTRMLRQSLAAIGKEDTYLQQQQELDRELTQLRAQLLDADNEAIAQNQLESIVREIADENGITISRSTPLQARKVGEHYSRVTVQINLKGGVPELTNFLQSISTYPKFLKVEEFYINGFRVRDQIRLQPRVQVSGFIRLSES